MALPTMTSRTLGWLLLLLAMTLLTIPRAQAQDGPPAMVRLAHDLANELAACPLPFMTTFQEKRIKVLQQPLLKQPGRYITPFADYFMELVTDHLVQGDHFLLVRPTADHCTFDELKHRTLGKSRGSGGINNALGILEGSYVEAPKQVNVSLWIRNDEGNILARACRQTIEK